MKTGHVVTLLVVLLAAWLVGGCDAGDPAAPSRPSATASMDTTPIVRFGGLEEQPLHQVTDAVLVGDTLILAESSTGTLRYYDLGAGRELKVVGGTGGGPGEFQDLSWIQMVGGSLYAYDSDQLRVSEFTLDGRFLGSVVLEPSEEHGYPRVRGVFADGSMLIESLKRGPRPASGTVFRFDLPLLRFDAKGGFTDSLSSYEGTETYTERLAGGRQFYTDRIFGRESDVVVSGDRYYVVENDDYRIAAHDASGTRVEVLSPDGEFGAHTVSREDVADVRARLVASAPEWIDFGPVVDRMPMPDSFPPYGWDGEREMRLLTATETGQLWVLNFRGVRDSTPLWTVYRADGAVRGHVSGPPDADVLTTAGERVVLKRWSAQDVESVEIREIEW